MNFQTLKDNFKYFNTVLNDLDDDIKEYSFANETTESSTGISGLLGKQWMKDLIKLGRENAYLLQGCAEYTVSKGNKDFEVPIESTEFNPTVGTSEATDVTWTDISNLSSITLTPTLHRAGVAISGLAVSQSQVALIEYARWALAKGFITDLEAGIVTEIETGTPTATLFGGDASSTGTLETGDVLTPDLIASAASELKAVKWYSEKDRPYVLYISPEAEGALMKDAQFTNAAEFGARDAVLNGEIARYVGARVLSSPNMTAATDWGSGSLAGHVLHFVKSKVHCAVGWQENFKMGLDYEWDRQSFAHRVYINSIYDIENVQESAVVQIKVADA